MIIQIFVVNYFADENKVKIVKLDMSDYAAVEKVTNEVLGELEKNGKKLDVIVENAGVGMKC